MNYKLLKRSLAIVLSMVSLISLAAIIKFNVIDVPYLGNPTTYQTDKGESIVISERVDRSVVLSTPKNPRAILRLVKSAAGEKYSNEDQALIFWRNGNEFFVEESGNIIYQGRSPKAYKTLQ